MENSKDYVLLLTMLTGAIALLGQIFADRQKSAGMFRSAVNDVFPLFLIISLLVYLDAEWFVFMLTVLSLILTILEKLYFSKVRQSGVQANWALSNAAELLPIFFLVFMFRSFAYEGFRIPSESMEPTLLVNDFVLVDKHAYGVRLPLINYRLLGTATPQRGDVLVFKYPPDPSQNYIKRVIGVPGDEISYINKVLYINGKKMNQDLADQVTDEDAYGQIWNVHLLEENLNGVKHKIYRRPERSADNLYRKVVPARSYFVMGDNRDNSLDSRYWGFVPDRCVVGQAKRVMFSWDANAFKIRRERFAAQLNE